MPDALTTLPLLTQDNTRMDWKRARYAPSVQVQGAKAVVANELRDAPELEALVAQGSAQWVVDVRCPKTLYAKMERSAASKFEADWAAWEVDGPVYLRPGLVAVENLRMSADGLLDLWGPGEVEIPMGWWLAQGRTVISKPLVESLLTFRRSENLAEGRMSVEKDLGSGNTRFIIGLAPGLYAARHTDRDIHMAGLIAVFGLLGADSPDEETDDVVLRAIKAKLEEAGAPAWGEENYDPALAATAVEKFLIPAAVDDDDDA